MKLFTRKPAGPPPYEKDPIGFLLWDAQSRIDIVRNAIPGNIAKKDWELVSRNCETAFNAILERGAIHARRRDFEQAREALGASTEFFGILQGAAANAHQDSLGFVHASNFMHGQLAAVISGQWEQALSIASGCRSNRVREEGGGSDSGGPPDEIAKLLAAAIEGDLEGFVPLRRRFNNDRHVDAFWVKFFPYDELLELLLRGETAALEKGLRDAEENFNSRAHDRSTNHEQLLAGCRTNNAMVIDVWSVAVLSLAQNRGININLDSQTIPSPERLRVA